MQRNEPMETNIPPGYEPFKCGYCGKVGQHEYLRTEHGQWVVDRNREGKWQYVIEYPAYWDWEAMETYCSPNCSLCGYNRKMKKMQRQKNGTKVM